MHRVVVSFAVGLIAGFVLMQLVCRGFLLFAEGDVADATGRGLSPASHQQGMESRYEVPFLLASLAAALACGCGCGLAARPAPVRRKRSGTGEPLTPDEVRTVARACRFCDLSDKGADYLQGLIVGRLVESDPALARRVDSYDMARIERLLTELLRRQDRVPG